MATLHRTSHGLNVSNLSFVWCLFFPLTATAIMFQCSYVKKVSFLSWSRNNPIYSTQLYSILSFCVWLLLRQCHIIFSGTIYVSLSLYLSFLSALPDLSPFQCYTKCRCCKHIMNSVTWYEMRNSGGGRRHVSCSWRHTNVVNGFYGNSFESLQTYYPRCRGEIQTMRWNEICRATLGDKPGECRLTLEQGWQSDRARWRNEEIKEGKWQVAIKSIITVGD